jgi:hypothetical protein
MQAFQCDEADELRVTAKQKQRSQDEFENHGQCQEVPNDARRMYDGLGPQIFDGKQPVRSFLGQMDAYKTLMRWSEEEAALHFGFYLIGDALHYFEMLPVSSKVSYKEITSAMSKRFGRQFSPLTLREEFRKLRQVESEDLRVYADRVRDLAIDAFVGLPSDYVEEEMAKQFLVGLDAKDAALFVMNTSKATLDDTRRAVQLLERQNILGVPRANAEKEKFMQ